MTVQLLKPRFALRELFDEVVELPPEVREAKIASLDLPPALGVRLQAMVVFDELVELAPELRPARIAELNLPEAVRSRLQAMLAADTKAPALLKASAAEAIGRLRDDADEALGQSLVGTCIGNFRLLALIGHGGSSVVFRAARAAGDGSQTVALKLLRTGLYSADAQRRFRREQAILAQLTHPNIASLIEGGVSSAGIPYIAMEMVDGLPITDAANERGLDVEQRLAWFHTLCRTIEAAHNALIVHRDLKPSNLLITRDGDLKVLDFGIAKLIDNDEYATRTQSISLTPEYAAPEQFGSAPQTTAVDVYALGIVLGELLTGKRLGGDLRASAAVAADHGSDVPLPRGLPERGLLARRLRGDLDAILACALADESALRYHSAGAFADDIARYLARKPVRAHPPSRLYRTRKFVRRHRGAVAVTATLMLAILASLGVVAWQAHSIAHEAQRAQSTRDFLLRVFSAAEPAGPRLGPPTVADVVRASVREAQHSTSLQPSVRIELINALGGVLRKQGDVKGSLQLLEDNYRNAIASLGATDPTTLQAGLGLAEARSDGGLRASARPLLDELITQSRYAAGPELQARLLVASANLGTERFERERALAESAAAVALCEHDCDAHTRILTLATRGYVLSNFNDETAAIPVLEQAVIVQRQLFDGPHVEIADTLEALSRAYRRLGNLDRAESLARESLAIIEASLPDPHQRRASALDTLRQVLIDSRKFDEAVALGLRVIAMDEAALGPRHPGVATDQNTLGFTYMLQGDFTNAAQRFRTALAISEAIPDNDRRSAIYQADLGYSTGLSGDMTTGMRLIHTALDRFRAQTEIDYSEVASALEKLGDLQRRSGELDAAQATFEESDAIYREKLRTAPGEWHARTLIGLGRTLADRRDSDARAASTLREGIDRITTARSRISPLRVEARTALAEVLARVGNMAEARRLLAEAGAEDRASHDTLPADIRRLLQRATGAIQPQL
ncbi:MAG TPA: tetratricopeptide repeat protein [Rudaea sp.]|nr:tetratricopeptide repeat protein [Rudaea sp.]